MPLKTCHCGATMNPTVRMQTATFHECPDCGALKRMKQDCRIGGNLWGARKTVLNLATLGVQYFDGLQASAAQWDAIPYKQTGR